MSEPYSAKEGLEHAERAHESLHGEGEGGGSKVERAESAMLAPVPLIAAILAVFAGLTSLYAGRIGESMLSLKNEGILAQARASDTWAEYQADSLKAHLAETATLLAAAPALKQKFDADDKVYRGRQGPLKAEALKLTDERTSAIKQADKLERRKLTYDVAVALFEIAIVLASVSAMMRRPAIVFVALALGLAAVGFCVYGFFV